MTAPTDPAASPVPVQAWAPAAGFVGAAFTRRGSARATNQDACLAIPAQGDRPWLLAVADGVGGQDAGEVAAHAAITALDRAWRGAWDARAPRPDAILALRDACDAADDAVRAVTTAPATHGAATTLTVATIGAHGLVVAQAGDSTAWVRDDRSPLGTAARRVTPLHTVIEAENATRARAGRPRLSEDEVARHPERGAITTYLGIVGGCPFDIASVPLAGALPVIIVTCTDGVTDVLPPADLDRVLLTGDAAQVAGAIARAVEARRGRDDATAVVLVATTFPLPFPAQRGGFQQGAGAVPSAPLRTAGSSRPSASDDPYGLRAASRRPGGGPVRTVARRALAVAGLGTVALAAGGGLAGAWPLALRLVESFRGSAGADPVAAARDYLAQMATGDHGALWLRLTANARRQVGQDEFVRRHHDFLAEIGASKAGGAPVSGSASAFPGSLTATVTCDVAYASTRFGELRARVAMPFLWEDGAWRLDWTPAVLLPDLVAGRRVRVASDPPVRGTLLDRAGRPLASPPVASPGPAGLPTDAGQAPAGRAYPAGEVAGPLVGYVAEATPAELATLAGRGYVPGDRVGRAGLERVAETHLAGARGSRLDVLEPSGIVVTTLATVPPRHGGSVVTTLDLDLQRVAEAALGARVGSVVAIDLPSGAIRAAATWPRYDPAAFETGRGVAALLDDPRTPLLDRPVQGLYPPGSTFKVVTMAAAMAHGVAEPASEFTCTGTWTGLPGVSQRCWLPSGHGTVTLADGLTLSCNSVFYELGKRLDALDAAILPAVARQAGLGAVTGAFPGEEPAGLVPDAAWKRATLKEPWTPGDTVNLAIGQGQLLVTPLQLATTYGLIATGRPVAPSILGAVRLPGGNVEQAIPTPAPAIVARAWTPAALAVMRASLAAVISSRTGTAAHAFAGSKVAAIVAGKTGTAENQPGKPTHAWFAGYGPVGTPSVAVVAMVEHGGEGSGVAAPIARKVLEAILA